MSLEESQNVWEDNKLKPEAVTAYSSRVERRKRHPIALMVGFCVSICAIFSFST